MSEQQNKAYSGMSKKTDRKEVVERILADRAWKPSGSPGRGRASVNIALCKYWGKRDRKLNLPFNSSLSVTLPGMDVETELSPLTGSRDEIELRGPGGTLPDDAAARVSEFLDLFRPRPDFRFRMITRSSVPPAAGLASSAAAFASLVRALDNLFDWRLSSRELSILARLGSGSACRSVYRGAVIWHAGKRNDGMDSFAEPLNIRWEAFRIGVVMVSASPKEVGSRPGMNHTVETSPLYACWPESAERDLAAIVNALKAQDMEQLGVLAEQNALCMHATMMAARPPLVYWTVETLASMRRIWELRRNGCPVYFTIDAGPNLKLLYAAEQSATVKGAFREIREFAPLAGNE